MPTLPVVEISSFESSNVHLAPPIPIVPPSTNVISPPETVTSPENVALPVVPNVPFTYRVYPPSTIVAIETLLFTPWNRIIGEPCVPPTG